MSELEPSEFYGFPIVDTEEIGLFNLIFHNDRLEPAEPITKKLGIHVIESDTKIINVIEYQTHHHLDMLSNQGYAADYKDDFSTGVYEGYCAVLGVMSLVVRYREGNSNTPLSSQLEDSDGVLMLSDEVVERFESIVDSYIWADKSKGEDDVFENYTDFLSKEDRNLTLFVAQIVAHAVSRGYDQNIMHVDGLNDGMYIGMNGALTLCGLAHEEMELAQLKDGLVAWSDIAEGK